MPASWTSRPTKPWSPTGPRPATGGNASGGRGTPGAPPPIPGVPDPTAPGAPDFGAKIERLRDKLKGSDHKDRIRNRIQRTRVDRYSYEQKHRTPAEIPHDATYDAQVAAANRDRGNSLIGLSLQEGAANRDFGFGQQYLDPSSALYNPYSRASLLQKSYTQQQNRTTNSFASAGQLYSGALQRGVESDRMNFDADWHEGESDYTRALAEVASGRVGAETTYGDALATAEEENLGRALELRPEDAPPPPKVVQDYKKRLREKLENTEGKKKRKKIKKRIQSIPDQYED